MTLGELIISLLDIDIEHPDAHDEEVFLVESEDEGHYWLIVGEGEYQV